MKHAEVTVVTEGGRECQTEWKHSREQEGEKGGVTGRGSKKRDRKTEEERDTCEGRGQGILVKVGNKGILVEAGNKGEIGRASCRERV